MSLDRPEPTRSDQPIAGTPVEDGPTVVVTGIAISRTAREALAQRLGPGHIVVDIRDAGDTADIVLIPPASGQLIGSVRAMFPAAQILVTEFTDIDFDADFAGPVRRSIESGVDGYFVVPSLDELAAVTQESARRPKAALTTGADAGRQGELPPNLVRQIAASDPTREVRIDVCDWAEQLDTDVNFLMKIARPLLDQLRRQGLRINLINVDDNPKADGEVGITTDPRSADTGSSGRQPSAPGVL